MIKKQEFKIIFHYNDFFQIDKKILYNWLERKFAPINITIEEK